VEGCCALCVGGELGPHLTLSPGPMPTFVPSGILIHSVIWPQYTNVTDRQIGQRSRGIRRTIRQITYDYLLSFLVNVNSRELTFTFAVHVWYCCRPFVRLSVSQSVCRLTFVHSDVSIFRQCLYVIWYLGHPLTSTENFTEIVPGEPLCQGG